MLRFSKWPPEKGGIHYTRHHANRDADPGSKPKPITINGKEHDSLFYNIGTLLAANIDDPTPGKVLELAQTIDFDDHPEVAGVTDKDIRLKKMSVDPKFEDVWASVLAGATSQIRSMMEAERLQTSASSPKVE